MSRCHRVLITLAILPALVACGGPASNRCQPDPPRPGWVDAPRLDDAIAVVGIARSAASPGRARDMAEASGRSRLANLLQTKVAGMTERFFRQAEINGDGGHAEDFTRMVERQLTKQTLHGAEPMTYWTDACAGDVYVHMVLQPGAVIAATKAAGAQAARELNLIEEKAQDALKQMDAAIEQEFGPSGKPAG